jgi:hypothetical protein
MKIFTISLIKLDVDKDLIIRLMYHMYNVHQSSKCVITNLLFPKSKETCDEILSELLEDQSIYGSGETDQEILVFLSTLMNKIKNDPFDRDIDAVSVATKTFGEINEHCKVHQGFQDQGLNGKDLSLEEFSRCQIFLKELVLYNCMDKDQRELYFHKKKIKLEFRKNIDKIYKSSNIKCSRELYNKITKKNKLKPVLWEIRRNHGDDIIFACGDQRKKMDFILFLLQKIYL